MQTITAENGKSTGFKLAHLGAKAAEGKILAEDLVDIGKRKAQRAIRRGYSAGEDYLDESTYYIKHHPWQSVRLSRRFNSRSGAPRACGSISPLRNGRPGKQACSAARVTFAPVSTSAPATSYSITTAFVCVDQTLTQAANLISPRRNHSFTFTPRSSIPFWP